jgi:hypothetical protein
LFNISMLTTNPNPSTKDLPLGALVVLADDSSFVSCAGVVTNVVVAVGVKLCTGERGASETVGVGTTFIV